MSTQAAFYRTDPSLDSSIASESLHLGNGFSPEFISLSLLEKGSQHQDIGMPSMQFSSNHTGSVQAMASNMQGQGDEIKQPRLRNRTLRPAPRDSRKESISAGMNKSPPSLHSYPSVLSFSSFSSSSCGVAGHDAEFGFDKDRVSPLSDISSDKSSSPLRWQSSVTDKRAKHRKRNRVAASKSRQKKKRETDQLQNRFQDVSRRRSSLDDEIKTLHSQLLSLKDQILMHSRCEDEAIHLYLGRMVKQVTKHDSISSSSTGEPDDGDARNHRPGSGSVPPSHDVIAGFHGCPNPHDHNLSEVELSHFRYTPVNMGDTRDLSCGTEKPMMNHEIVSQPPDANIFDLQLGIS